MRQWVLVTARRWELEDRTEELRALVRRVVEDSRLSQQQIARDAGMSYAALHAWIIGTRTPRSDSLLQLAAGLELRADTLRKLATELRESTER